MTSINWFKGGSAGGSAEQDSFLSLLSIMMEGILSRKLDQVATSIGDIMTTIQDIKAKQDTLLTNLASEKSLNQSILKLLQDDNASIADLGQKLKDAINNQDPTALQAVSDEMDQIQTAQSQNMSDIAAAVTANTPAATVPTAPPVTPAVQDATSGDQSGNPAAPPTQPPTP